MLRKPITISLLSLFLLGCDANQSMQVAKSGGGPRLKSIPSADYLVWRQFPIGTRVTRRKTMVNQFGKAVVTTTMQLDSCTEKLVEVKSQITVDRGIDFTENPIDVVQYPSHHAIPEEMSEDQFRAPTPEAEFVGQELIRVLDKDYDAAVYRWNATLESGKVEVKGWFSDEFPGRQLKLEFNYDDEMTTSRDEVVALDIPS